MDVEIKIGFPYLYRHNGSCDHILIFSDLRLVDNMRDGLLFEEDSDGIQHTFSSRNKRQNCEVCDGKFAALIIVF